MPIPMPIEGQNLNNLNIQQPVEGQPVGLSPEPGMPAMSQEEMKTELDRMLTKVNDKEQSVKTKMSVDKFKFDAMKANLIRSLFEMLQKAGVNPGDPTSIKDFLSQLQQRDPDLYSIFEIAFNDLMDFGAEQQPMPPTGMSEMSGIPTTGAPEMTPQGGMPGILKQRPGKNKVPGLLKKFSNLNNKVFRKK